MAALVVLSTACGPKHSTELAMKQYSTDIVFGTQSRPAPAPPVAGAEPAPAFPSFIVPPPPSPTTPAGSLPTTTSRPAGPPAATRACPPDDPFVFPQDPATSAVFRPPTAGSYTFRQEGNVTVSGAPAIALPAQSIRRVGNVTGTPATGLNFDVAIESLGDTTTTTYQARQSTGDPTLDGVFITHVVTRRASGSIDEFAPANGVRILPLPAAAGATWNDVGTDPVRGTSMVVQGTVDADKARVNACGTPLDAWGVQVSGRLLGPNKDLTLTAAYAVGTQLGGFVLREQVSLSGTDGGSSVHLTSAATINDPRPTAAT